MRLHFATIPVFGGEQAEADLNSFLATHRVLALDRQLVQDGAASAWAVSVTYAVADRPAAVRKGQVDYREVLSEAEFAVYARLRTLRKELAEKEGVPPYALFTNEQLAAMVQRGIRTVAALRELPGVGPARVEKYASAFLGALNPQPPEERAKDRAP